MKKLSSLAPEIFFSFLGMVYLASDLMREGNLNYIALLVSWLLFLQIIYRNRYLGIAYGIILFAGAGLSIFSVVESYQGVFDNSLQGHPVVRYLLYVAAFIMSAVMIVKYARTRQNYDENPLTISF